MRATFRGSFLLGIALLIAQPLARAQDKLRIAVVSKADQRSFWQSIHAGALAGAEAAGKVEVEWRAPKKDQDLAQQIALVDQCVKDNVSGIAIAPLDFEALVTPLARAQKKGIAVLVFDSRLKGEPGKDYVSFVATDSKNGGMLAGDEMATLIGGKGKVIVLRYTVGQANLLEREDGFIAALGKHKGIRVETEIRTNKPTVEDVTATGLSMTEKLQGADGLFCSSQSLTLGMLEALRKTNLAGKIKFIGFDTSVQLVEALKNGEISALIAQDPTKMGYFAVKTLADHIRGNPVQPTIDTGVLIITKSNLNDPSVQRLLSLPSLVK